jgi:diacylglycerol kinase family enzyme
MEQLPLILNPHAGRGATREADALRTAFAAAGTNAEVQVVEGLRIQEVARSMARAGAPVIAVAGGDGTISSAANALAGTSTALLPVPLGTLNHFAGRYGVPTVEAAVHAFQRSQPHDVPLGFLNDVAFINNASCGFYPHVVRSRDAMERMLPRPVAFWIAGLMMLARMPLMRLELALDNDSKQLLTPALWVGLGRDSLRLHQPGDAVHEGDVLEIVTPTTQRRAATVALMMRTLFKLKRGAHTPEDRALDVFHAASFTLDSPHRIDVGLDGEAHRLRPPLHFRFERRGVKVLCLVAP